MTASHTDATASVLPAQTPAMKIISLDNQALERTAPVLLMLHGALERRSFDYIRHSTIDLLAALNTSTGKVTGKPSAQHWAVDFRDCLDEIDKHGTRPGHPGDLRQPVRAHGTRRAVRAAGTSPRPVALHPDLFLLDQPGRAVVRRKAAPLPGPRRLLLTRRAHHRAGSGSRSGIPPPGPSNGARPRTRSSTASAATTHGSQDQLTSTARLHGPGPSPCRGRHRRARSSSSKDCRSHKFRHASRQ